MANVQYISPVDATDDVSISIYTQPFVWDSDYELDVLSEVDGQFELTEQLNSYHTATVRLKTNRYKFLYTESDYYLFKGMRVKITFNDKDYKMIIRKIKPDIKGGTVTLSLVSQSYALYNPPYAQIRVQNSFDGNYYLEDVLWQALYDTGQHNFFLIKLSDGSYYTPSSTPDLKTPIDSIDDLVYVRVPVINILNDLCAKTGCIWYESDLENDETYSIINIVNIETDYDVPSDKILYVSTSEHIFDISPDRDFDTISNTIYFDELPFYIQENESIDRYGSRSGKVINFPDDGDISKYNKLMFAMRSVLKDPEVAITVRCKRLLDIDSIDKYVKIVNDDDDYDKESSIDRKYRIQSVTYDLVKNNTTISIGNKHRTLWLEKLESVAKGTEDNKDSNESQKLGYQDELRIQVHTDKDDIGTLTETSSGFGVRLGIDYPYDSTYSPHSVYYMSDDDVRTGN